MNVPLHCLCLTPGIVLSALGSVAHSALQSRSRTEHNGIRRNYSTTNHPYPNIIIHIYLGAHGSRGSAKTKNPKIRDYYGSGWVGLSLSEFCFFMENRPKIALNQC